MDATECRLFNPMDDFCIHADPSGVMHIPGPISAEAFAFLKNNRRVLYEEKLQQIKREQEEHDREMNAHVQDILHHAEEMRRRCIREFALVVDNLAAFEEVEAGCNEWPFIKHDAVCEKCRKSPCEWIYYSHKACAYAGRNLVVRQNRTNYQVNRRQRHHCTQLVRLCTEMRNDGALAEEHTELPCCVTDHVCALFPLTTDDTQG